MARRDENECAYCAQELAPAARVIGQDWKVYCSEACAEIGALATNDEAAGCRTDEEAWLRPQSESFQRSPT